MVCSPIIHSNSPLDDKGDQNTALLYISFFFFQDDRTSQHIPEGVFYFCPNGQ